jgi:hypothetical protein
MCGRPGALVQLMRLTRFLVVDSAAVRYGPPLFRNWGLSGICADCRECAAATTHASLVGGNRRSSSGSLAKSTVIRRASSRVRRFGRRARSGSARLALETTLMTPNRPSSVEAIAVLRFHRASRSQACHTRPHSTASYVFLVFRCIRYSPTCEIYS